MCTITAGLMIGGQILAHGEANKQASASNKAAAANFEASERYRQKIDRYNNENFRQDVQYFNDLLDYQKDEFGRQAQSFDKAKTAVTEDYVSQVGQILTRQVEEYIATNLLGQDAVREGRRERSSANAMAAEMGVQGNTIDALVNDVRRQVGETMTANERQSRSVMRQLQNEALGLSARADSEIASIPLQSFSPISPARSPAPSQPGTPPLMSQGPGIGSLIAGIGSSAAGGYKDYYASRNMAMPKGVIDTLLLKPGPILNK